MTPKPNLSPAQRKKIQNLLSQAIQKEDIPRVHKLLAQGADACAPGGDRMRSPLMDAASRNNRELIKIFIPFNDIDATDSHGRSALHYFIQSMAYGIPVDWRDTLRSLCSKKSCAPDEMGRSALTLAATLTYSTSIFDELLVELSPTSSLSSMEINGKSACVAALLFTSNCTDLRNARRAQNAKTLLLADPHKEKSARICHPEYGTLAHLAASHGQVDFLRALEPFAEFEARDHLGRTPLMAAAIACQADAVGFLLSRGCNPQAVDFDGCDALMLGVEANASSWKEGDAKCSFFASLAQLCDPAARDILGDSALDKIHYFRNAACPGVVEGAIAASGPQSPKPWSFWPALRKLFGLSQRPSAQRLRKLHELLVFFTPGHISQIGKFLGLGACATDCSFGNLAPPIALAALAGNFEAIKLLLPFRAPFGSHPTRVVPLHCFLHSKHRIESDEHLLPLALLASPEDAKRPDKAGRTALSMARPSASLIPQTLDILGPVSDWFALDAKGGSILHMMHARTACPAWFAALWNSHPDQSWLAASVDRDGNSLAHLAAQIGDAGLLKLLSPQMDLNGRNSSGHTPLMAIFPLCKWFSDEAIELIVAWSDCRAVDPNGCDPLMMAIEESRVEDAQLIAFVRQMLPRASLCARDFIGESALDKAIDRGFSTVASLIQALLAVRQERDELACASAAANSRSRPISTRI